MTEPALHEAAPLLPVAHRLIASWPIGSFVENIAALPDGGFAVSVHNQKQVLHVTRTGESRVLATLPTSPAGLIATADALFAVGGEPGQGPHHLFKIGPDGAVSDRAAIPDTLFLNGFTPARPGHAYTVDSIIGVVIEIDLETAASRVVLRHDLLTKISAEPMLPGANGIKLGDDAIFITNTDRAVVLRAALGADGPSGALTIIAEHLRGDDLALDQAGGLYITNHIHNTLTWLRPNGERTAIAGPEQGMAGCTACVFAPDDPHGLYVTTTGGVVMPLDGVMQEAKLVRLEIADTGRPVAFRS